MGILPRDVAFLQHPHSLSQSHIPASDSSLQNRAQTEHKRSRRKKSHFIYELYTKEEFIFKKWVCSSASLSVSLSVWSVRQSVCVVSPSVCPCGRSVSLFVWSVCQSVRAFCPSVCGSAPVSLGGGWSGAEVREKRSVPRLHGTQREGEGGAAAHPSPRPPRAHKVEGRVGDTPIRPALGTESRK